MSATWGASECVRRGPEQCRGNVLQLCQLAVPAATTVLCVSCCCFLHMLSQVHHAVDQVDGAAGVRVCAVSEALRCSSPLPR